MRGLVQVLGIWDDHDYGMGNGDKSFAGKDIVKELFLEFIDEPEESVRRSPGWGLYQDYLITTKETSVHLILIDVRYDYDATTYDILGGPQTIWLD